MTSLLAESLVLFEKIDFMPFVMIIPDFAFGYTHKCFMHLKVALSIALIVVMELFFK
jgi:hypothetical protein